MISLISYILAVVIVIVIVIVIIVIIIIIILVIIIITIFIWPARSWLKAWAERGGRCTARGCEIKMLGKCGFRIIKLVFGPGVC